MSAETTGDFPPCRLAARRRRLRPAVFYAGVPIAGLAIVLLAVMTSGVVFNRAPQGAGRYIPVVQAARTYLAAHPVPPVPGMIAGIVTEQTGDVAWFCRRGRGSAAALAGNCGYWAGTMLTTDGHTVLFTCGSITGPQTAWQSCTSATPEYGHPGYVPEPGDYVYVPSGLRVSAGRDVRIIRPDAFDVWDPGPDQYPGVPAWCFPPKTPPANGC